VDNLQFSGKNQYLQCKASTPGDAMPVPVPEPGEMVPGEMGQAMRSQTSVSNECFKRVIQAGE